MDDDIVFTDISPNGPDLPPMESVWAWIAEDPMGEEGIVAFHSEATGWTPLVSGNADRVTAYSELARRIAKQTGQKINLYRYDRRTLVETIP